MRGQPVVGKGAWARQVDESGKGRLCGEEQEGEDAEVDGGGARKVGRPDERQMAERHEEVGQPLVVDQPQGELAVEGEANVK